MFQQGIGITLITGVLWCGIGIVYSCAARKGKGFYLFLFLSALFFALASWGGGVPRPASAGLVLAVAAIMIPAAAASQFGFLALGRAMRNGSHGVSWSIAQSAMVCPFAAGMLFFGESASLLRITGMLLLLAGLVPLGRSLHGGAGEGSNGRFPLPAFLAFGLIGLQQTLTLLPNRLPDVDEAALSWRIPLYSLCGLGWIFAVLKFREFGVRGILPLALLNGALAAAGQWTFFRSLDLLADCGAAGLAYPLAVGSSVALFFLYSIWFRRERPGLSGVAGVLLAVLGMIFLAF